MTRLGSQMVRTGLLDPAQLEAALDRQRQQGGYLGQHLVDAGFITREQLHDGLARQWQVDRRDLDRDPPRGDLLERHELRHVIELGWLPCEVVGGRHVVIATSVPPGPDLVEEVADFFPGLAVSFVACTRRDLDRFAVRIDGAPTAVRAVGPRRRLCPSAPVRDLLLGGAAVVVLGCLVGAPPDVLSAAVGGVGVIFLALVAVHLGGLVWWAARASASSSPSTVEPVADVLLPVYSVLVPVSGGAPVLQQVVADLASIDYPRSRLDIVMLVAADDAPTLQAVASHAPPSCVRVVPLERRAFADPVLGLDAGLALARGRYVVSLLPGEVLAPDQLRLAVEAFELDLHENLTVRRGRTPLAALRVERREWRNARSFASGLEMVEEACGLTRAFPWSGRESDLRSDLTSSHCNTRLLRRLGGWHAVATGGGGSSMRVAVLSSVTRCRHRPSVGDLVTRRADELARSIHLAVERARRFRWEPAAGTPRLADVLLGFVTPILVLMYPVAVVAAGCLLLRFDELDAGNLPLGLSGLAAVTVAVLLLTAVTGIGLARRRGRRALGHVLAVPAHWLVHAVAAWYAVLVLLPCRPPMRGSSTVHGGD
jgi:hypothetical protein